ncbi:Ca2+-transporting ATPase [Chitinophaga rupis]|uniref:Ca2+-transporting ATPase n=1 Tax=Chitinophaga rupis TaxID=573321 RepID=A0A1H7PUQ3_9BACT|nr:cation-translocating P-type ATPase [Chitinophaga rupis]SEL39473.1 Ca2+-transporting ATPase [Chitinophaga rupis]
MESVTTGPDNGLAATDIPRLQQQYGKNIFRPAHNRTIVNVLADIFKEPMMLLLIACALLYFLLGNVTEGWMMLIAMLLVAAVSLYQDVKSARALDALSQYTAPLATVIRDGGEITIPAEELVPGDTLLLSEGAMVPADGTILSAHDLTVNESITTGESLPVLKDAHTGTNQLYQGTTINSGKCTAIITATGNHTRLGRLGIQIVSAPLQRTRLQAQVQKAVQRLALFGAAAFVMIFVVSFIKSHDLAGSLLTGLTLAMAAIPEEIPVAFSSFMALGAYYLSRQGIISRQPQIIEHLGAVSVLCLDKTGTITENRMKVVMVYDQHTGMLTDLEQQPLPEGSQLLYYAALASERHPFDHMEQAILAAFQQQRNVAPPLPEMVHEYPLEGQPPMMTHVYPHADGMLAVAKGAPEHVLQVCRLDNAATAVLQQHLTAMSARGYRILGVATAICPDGALPDNQDDFNWQFEGLVSLYDPPRQQAAALIGWLYAAGIRVKMITGDYPATALHIAAKIGMQINGHAVTGEEVMALNGAALQDMVKQTVIFARMFPEAKLKVISALKDSGEVVAMTGDGVNDGPALKAAHIGIAMGKKGAELARQAADLVITDDDLDKIPEAIRQGRKIYSNLKKAVRYITGIHIPIIFTAIVPLLMGWKYPFIFTPIHIIFLELIMGPTSSIFFEREPVEARDNGTAGVLNRRGLFSREELVVTLVQGGAITVCVLLLYYYFMQRASVETTRTIVFTLLLIANTFLTFVNRSFTENITRTIRYKNNLAAAVFLSSLVFLAVIHFIPAVRELFGLVPISLQAFGLCLLAAFVAVAWFEIYKVLKMRGGKKTVI